MGITSRGSVYAHDRPTQESDIVPLQSPPSRVSAHLLQALCGAKPVQRFSKGSILIRQDSAAMGVYVVKSGEVRVLLPTGQSQGQHLGVAGPGSMLGLNECMAGQTFRITVEAVEETTAVFIPQGQLLDFMENHGDFSMQVVRVLSEELQGLYEKFRSISAHPGRPRQRA